MSLDDYEGMCTVPKSEEMMIKDYMDVVYDQALEKLTPIEIAAILHDYKEFCVRYREEKDEEFASNQLE